MLPAIDISQCMDKVFRDLDIIVDEYIPNQTKVFIVNGANESGKDSFIYCCSKFAPVNNISTIDLIKDMAKIVDLHENRDFLSKLKNLTYKHTNYIDKWVESNLKEGYLNFVHVREEKFFNKKPYKYFSKIFLLRPDGKEEPRFTFNTNIYDHIILNTDLKLLPYKSQEFIEIYCNKKKTS